MEAVVGSSATDLASLSQAERRALLQDLLRERAEPAAESPADPFATHVNPELARVCRPELS